MHKYAEIGSSLKQGKTEEKSHLQAVVNITSTSYRWRLCVLLTFFPFLLVIFGYKLKVAADPLIIIGVAR